MALIELPPPQSCVQRFSFLRSRENSPTASVALQPVTVRVQATRFNGLSVTSVTLSRDVGAVAERLIAVGVP